MPLNEVERKLAEYRAKKEREARINHYRAEVKTMFSKYFGKKRGDSDEEGNPEEPDIKENLLDKDENILVSQAIDPSDIDSDDQFSDTMQDSCNLTLFDYVYYTLWFILWLTVYAIFIKLQFGTIYLILSGIVGIYLNTRTGPKKKNEVSAYSVFNKNCKSIDGTLTAEQFEREIMFGGLR